MTAQVAEARFRLSRTATIPLASNSTRSNVSKPNSFNAFSAACEL